MTLPNTGILLNAIVLKEAQASSAVENIITNHDKLYQALTATSVQADPATKEVLRYREVLLFALVNSCSVLNEAFFRTFSGTFTRN